MGIERRGTRWAAILYDRGDRTWLGSFDTRREAVRAHADALTGIERRRSSAVTVDEWAGQWLEQFPPAEESTRRTYAGAAKAAARAFAGVEIGDVNRQQARAWALEHPSYRSPVRVMFRDAAEVELVTDNPFSNLRLPQSRGRKHRQPPSVKDVDRLANLCEQVAGPEYGPHLRAQVMVAALAGVRPGELYALRASDADLRNGTLRAAGTVEASGRRKPYPKNGRERVVTLPPPACDALAATHSGRERLFVSPRGRPLTKSSHGYWWRELRAAAGLRGTAFVELRHHCAWRLYVVMGLPAAEVAQQLGHTDGGRLIEDLYGHPDADQRRRAVAAAWADAPLSHHSTSRETAGGAA
ncbi:MAG: tyrosine-type recombinase/integrase [Thermoleophilia bacterium]|nr:tyrosine-type recombinase/integrase [Thermoleophilia bacterium]